MRLGCNRIRLPWRPHCAGLATRRLGTGSSAWERQLQPLWRSVDVVAPCRATGLHGQSASVSSSAAAVAAQKAKAAKTRLHGRVATPHPKVIKKVVAAGEVPPKAATPELAAEEEPMATLGGLQTLIYALQGKWIDDLGLKVEVTGDKATFSDSKDTFEFSEEEGVSVLRGGQFVGMPTGPVWRFPNGVVRRWARPDEALPGDSTWADAFQRYKVKRLGVWKQLCDALVGQPSRDEARRAELSRLRLEWEGDAVADSSFQALPSAQKAVLTAGHQLVPGVCVVHRKFNYRAVILGHEHRCTAPAFWRARMGVPLLPKGEAQPFYHCLVDERDRPGNQITFAAQENLLVSAEAFPIDSPAARMLFERCDEVKGYRPGPLLDEALRRHQKPGSEFAL
eukprot:TRINITY_DN47607_c0_g1_i1.p1 TRINITY_DN47607_c0_g1~~TRINITY_DN47607_c0_g1_i1.p1  ORF type:complete len:410 (+),score=70.86 TRINITY_DN47607_c0_g1_i1:47-1231(+)